MNKGILIRAVKNSRLTNMVKLQLMNSILSEYRIQKTNFKQSILSQKLERKLSDFLNAVNEVSLETNASHRGRLNLIWTDLTNYIENENNMGKTMYRVIWKNFEKYLLDNFPQLRFKANYVESAAMHRYYIFFEESTFHARMLYELMDDPQITSSIGKPVYALVILMCGVLGFCISPFVALFDAITRKPVDTNELQQMVNNLESFPEEKRARLISNVINSYRQSASSNSSTESKQLLSFLDSPWPLNEKWLHLSSYMTRRNGEYFHNNGRLLFNMIQEQLESIISAPQLQFQLGVGPGH
jgi:hypothetical protein